MRVYIFLIVFGVGFLVAGLSNLWLYLKEPRITETNIGNLQAIRNLRRVRITGGVLDAYDSTGNYISRILDTIHLPYVPPGRTDQDPVTVVLVTRKSDIKDAFQKFISSGDFDQDSNKTLGAYSELERLASTRTFIQGLAVGPSDSGNLRDDVKRTIPNLSEDFIVIEDGEDVSLFSGIGYLACTAFAPLVGWLVRPQKPSGPPPIPPHLKKAS